MAKAVKSIRVEPDLWERVQEHAAREGITTNAAVERFLEGGLTLGVLPLRVAAAKGVLQEAEHAAAHLAQPAPKPRSRWAVSR